MFQVEQLKKLLIRVNLIRGGILLVEGILFLSSFWFPAYSDHILPAPPIFLEVALILFLMSTIEIYIAVSEIKAKGQIIKSNRILNTIHIFLSPLIILNPLGLYFMFWQVGYLILITWFFFALISMSIIIIIEYVMNDELKRSRK